MSTLVRKHGWYDLVTESNMKDTRNQVKGRLTAEFYIKKRKPKWKKYFFTPFCSELY